MAQSLHTRHELQAARGSDLPGVLVTRCACFVGTFNCTGPLTSTRSSLLWLPAALLGTRQPRKASRAHLRPSRAHLAWQCPSARACCTSQLIATNRLQERLFGKAVAEVPPLPAVLDEADFVEDLAAGLEDRLRHGDLLIATDGSSVTDVAAFSVTLSPEVSHCLGLSGEDQSPYKAEVSALVFLVHALLLVKATGRIRVMVDCKSALDAARGCGALRVLCAFLVAGVARLRGRIQVDSFWVSSHGKMPSWVPPPRVDASAARLLNHAAEVAARDAAVRRARGCGRMLCYNQCKAAEIWEKKVLADVSSVAQYYDLQGLVAPTRLVGRAAFGL